MANKQETLYGDISEVPIDVLKEEMLRRGLSVVAIPDDATDPVVEDGFGGAWSKRCPTCDRLTIEVVRPGKIQCIYCG